MAFSKNHARLGLRVYHLIITLTSTLPFHSTHKKKQIGELFPGPSKTTRAYLHTEEDVRKALAAAGFTVRRTEMTGTSFYFSRLLEAVRE